MALPLLESVPNISVGRDVATVDDIVAATRAALGPRARLADVHRDSDHDRSVLTLIGDAPSLEPALHALARACVTHLDLHAGHGVHPRVGVLDVLPIIPLSDTETAAAAAQQLVARLGDTIGTELHVPVVRYGLDEHHQRIPGAGSTGEVRRGGPGTVADRIRDGDLTRLGGPIEPHPTAGVTIAGVRDVLVAFNVDLDVDDIDLARSIAAEIREAAGGDEHLPGVRALGLRLASRGIAQVSTNVERHRECGPARVLQSVARLAAERGCGVSAAELVGLAPDSALGPLRYACTGLGVPLLASADASLDSAIATLDPDA